MAIRRSSPRTRHCGSGLSSAASSTEWRKQPRSPNPCQLERLEVPSIDQLICEDPERRLRLLDSDLDGIDFVLDNLNHRRSEALWNILVENPRFVAGVVETSTNQSYENADRHSETSILGKKLKESAWLKSEAQEAFDQANQILDLLPKLPDGDIEL